MFFEQVTHNDTTWSKKFNGFINLNVECEEVK
jgi:hypothetical protein